MVLLLYFVPCYLFSRERQDEQGIDMPNESYVGQVVKGRMI
jgi:hypothetical protein